MPWGSKEKEPEWGPKVQAEGNPEFAIAVRKTYDSGSSGKRLWGGMVTVFYKDEPLFDIEGNVLDGKDGPWFSWAQRSFVSGGETRYKAVVWCYPRELSQAAVDAVDKHIHADSPSDKSASWRDEPPVADDEPPF